MRPILSFPLSNYELLLRMNSSEKLLHIYKSIVEINTVHDREAADVRASRMCRKGTEPHFSSLASLLVLTLSSVSDGVSPG